MRNDIRRVPISLADWNLIRPDLETLQRIGSESRGDRDIARIAASRHQNAAHARHIVARVEHVPAAADPGLEPRREIAHAVRWRRSDIAQVPGAVSRRNIHAAAESDREMRVVAADAGPLVESLRGAAGGAGVLVVECNVVMNVSRRWPARASILGRRAAEELPGRLRQQIGLAIAAAQAGTREFLRADPPRSPAVRSNTISSGWPLSLTTQSADRRRRPAGARTRLHRFPNASR